MKADENCEKYKKVDKKPCNKHENKWKTVVNTLKSRKNSKKYMKIYEYLCEIYEHTLIMWDIHANRGNPGKNTLK